MTSTVYIAKTVYGGDGLGRLGDGRVVFVPGAFPGEQVKAEIVEERRGFVRARLVEVVEPSSARIGSGPQPVPGMVYSNLSRKGELEAKSGQLTEFFDRARLKVRGGFSQSRFDPSVGDVDNSPETVNRPRYRNKVVYHFAREGAKWLLGYREEPSHRVVDVVEDPMARPEINAQLPEIRRQIMMLLTQGAGAVRQSVEKKGNLTIRWSRASGVKWWIGDAPDGMVIKEASCGRTFEVPADGFWQVNPEVGEALVKTVAAEYQRGAETAPEVLDLYCGVGVLGLSCHPPVLVGVESGRKAVDFAKKNAAAQGAEARFFAQEVGRNLRRLRINARTCVILDPPRGGLERGVAQFLARSRAPRIIYVSCDPATLVRDLRSLAHSYDIESVQWLDMFPRTARFETVVTLVKK